MPTGRRRHGKLERTEGKEGGEERARLTDDVENEDVGNPFRDDFWDSDTIVVDVKQSVEVCTENAA
jgi:hypothetical protein